MPKFRKKPVVIEAEQFTQEQVEAYMFDKVPLPRGVNFGSAHTHPPTRRIYSTHFTVMTIHGERATIVPGDWIMPEPDGVHFYPCKPDIFAATYEPATPPTPGKE
mgnify:CR=1 FL=1